MPKSIKELEKVGKDPTVKDEMVERDEQVTDLTPDQIEAYARGTKLAEAEMRRRKRAESDNKYYDEKVIIEGDKLEMKDKLKELLAPFNDHIEGLYYGKYKPPYQKKHIPGFLLKLNNFHKKGVDYGEIKSWSDNFTIERRHSDVHFHIGRLVTGTCTQINHRQKTYLSWNTNREGEIALLGLMGSLFVDYGPFLNAVIVHLSEIFKFETGEVDIVGYDHIVKRCNAVLRCKDERIANRHILLAGPAGTGKSMLAKRIVSENPDYIAMNINVEERWETLIPLLNEVLRFCKRKMLIVIDEIDEIGLHRDINRDRVFGLLRIMDGIEGIHNVKLLATTNRPRDLDPALLRYGRFGPVFNISEPSKEQKCQIIMYYANKYKFNIEVDRVVDVTHDNGYTGADIRAAFEEVIINGQEPTTEQVVKNLKLVKGSEKKGVMYQ